MSRNYKYYKIFVITALFVLSLQGCESKFEFEPDSDNVNTLVVEAMITNENKRHYVCLSKIEKDYYKSKIPADSAFVAVVSADSTFYYREDSIEKGKYYSEHDFAGIKDNVYYLHIEYQKITYSANGKMTAVTPPDTIKWALNTETGLYYLTHVADNFVKENPAMYEINLDWHDVEGYEDLPYDQTHALMYYYSLTTTDISQLFAPEKETVEFPLGTKIIERKYSLNHEHEMYIRSLLAETTWSGGFFDEAHGNLQTNIDNGAIGFFGVCTVYNDTIWVE